jgi:hypothetical protein
MSVHVEAFHEDNFESLKAAVSQTAQGRWFLEEFAKRQRSMETLAILETIRKLENSLKNGGLNPFMPPAEKAKSLSPQQLKFFKQDEELFVEPSIAPPAFQVVGSTPKNETKAATESKGAKLKIQRVPPAPLAGETSVENGYMSTEELFAATQPEAAAGTKQRIIIIRKPSSEIAEMSLMEEAQPEAAA